MMQTHRNLLAWSAAWLLLMASSALGAGQVQPGAYCPIPKPGQEPDCLDPARGTYGGFLDELAHGAPSDAATSPLEADLSQGAASERSYLALSTLAYGYYRLALRAAESPDADPTLLARLERWNALLARAYASSKDAAYRGAVRAAALDVHERSPAVSLPCTDDRGEWTRCTTTESVLRGFDRAGGEVGVRGSLQRLLERLRGRDGP